MSTINHPAHYGGANNPYEAIKVIEAWKLNFNLGNTIKYLSRAGKKGDLLEDLQKAKWYLEREIENVKAVSASIEASASKENATSSLQRRSTKKRSRKYETARSKRNTQSGKKSGSL